MTATEAGDGGTTATGTPRWLRWTAAVAIVATAFNLRPAVTSAGALLRDVQAATGLSDGLAGVLTSLPPLAFGVAALIGGAIGRRRGTGATLLVAMGLLAVALLLRVATDAPAWLVAWTVPALLAMGIGNVLLPVVVKRWFPDRVGTATGWYAVGLAAGTAAAAAVAVPLAAWGGSWRVGLAAWAVPAALAAVPWLWLVRHRDAAPGGSEVADDPVAGDARSTVSRVRRDRRSWALAGYFGLQSLAAYVAMGWLPTIYRDAGVSPDVAGYLLAAVMLIGVPVSLTLPVLAARRPDQRALVLALAGFAACAWTGLVVAPAAAPWLWAALLGIGLGAFPLALVLIGLRAASPAGTAALSALAQGGGYLLAAGGPLAIGALHDATASWTPPLLVVIALLVPQVVCGSVAARPGHVDAPPAGPA